MVWNSKDTLWRSKRSCGTSSARPRPAGHWACPVRWNQLRKNTLTALQPPSLRGLAPLNFYPRQGQVKPHTVNNLWTQPHHQNSRRNCLRLRETLKKNLLKEQSWKKMNQWRIEIFTSPRGVVYRGAQLCDTVSGFVSYLVHFIVLIKSPASKYYFYV